MLFALLPFFFALNALLEPQLTPQFPPLAFGKRVILLVRKSFTKRACAVTHGRLATN
jgi:hypothetical protein